MTLFNRLKAAIDDHRNASCDRALSPTLFTRRASSEAADRVAEVLREVDVALTRLDDLTR